MLSWTFGDDTVSGHENHLDYSSFVYGKDVEDLPWLLFHWPILYVQYLGRIVFVSVLLSGDLALEFSKHPWATFPQLINSESHIKTEICDKLSLFFTIQLQFLIYYNKTLYYGR